MVERPFPSPSPPFPFSFPLLSSFLPLSFTPVFSYLLLPFPPSFPILLFPFLLLYLIPIVPFPLLFLPSLCFRFIFSHLLSFYSIPYLPPCAPRFSPSLTCSFLRHGSRAVGVSQTAAFSRGHYLYSAWQLSRWASAHILVFKKMIFAVFDPSQLTVSINCSFWAIVCKTVRPMLSDRCPVCLSVCRSCLSVRLVYCGQRLDGSE